MIIFVEVIWIFLFLITPASSLKIQDNYIIFNTSANKYLISTSIATNLEKQFALYCPLLISTKNYTARFIPTEQKRKLSIDPKFIDDTQLLYNDKNDAQYWYGIKKSLNLEKYDFTAKFALSKLIVDEKIHQFLLPLFSLPLTFLNMERLYKCDDVLISYRQTHNLVDITVFTTKEEWTLQPEATWGFRNKDDIINFSRQTYPLGTKIHLNIATNKYCLLDQNLPINTYNLEQKQIYTLNDLLIKYSTSLQIKNNNIKQQSSQQQSNDQIL